jgi:predicted ATPase
MLKKIKLENFKCFKKLEIDINMLNVFSGINGMGKSTAIQSLLMLRQSYKQGFLPEKVCLNGDFVLLGTGKDVLFEDANEETIKIELTEEQETIIYKIKYKKDSDVLEVKKPYLKDSLSLTGSFEYLNAERTSPQVIYPKSTFHVDSIMQLGINGQFAVHYLLKHSEDPLPWNSCFNKESFLKGAVQYWLNEISPNVKIDLQDIDNTDLARIGYYFSTKEGKTNVFRPTNVGFGISYILPVIIAILKAEKGSILIIENPEAHLHPKGQRKIGELISMCASSGVQIFIETHSDHVLNGIRIATKRQLIKHIDVSLFFFDKIEKDNVFEHIVKCPKINEKGKLDYWPDGFFDEWEKALDEII